MSLRFAIPVGTPISQLTEQQQTLLLERGRAGDPAVAQTVAALIDDVRINGDAALRAQALRFDGVDNLCLDVPRERWQSALQSIDPAVRAALETAAENIAAFHRAQLPQPLEIELRPGLKLGRRADPLARVAVYAPGGRAAYPSSVLMGVVPARVAGVREVIVCTPAGTGGEPAPAVLAASAIANADRVFAVGGAAAIAAVAFGTKTVLRADKVVGPGNAYVTEAKRQLNGTIATDSPAGPSEILILADDSPDPLLVAYELLAQAEHDPDASAVLVSTSPELLVDVANAIDREIAAQPRGQIINAALAARAALLLAEDTDAMLRFSAQYAPEHLALYVREPRCLLSRVTNAGTVCLGSATSVAFGDYVTGANHVLPTATLARAYSGLSVLDFLRWTTYQEVDLRAASQLAPITRTLAVAEGLFAHARAAELRV